MLGHKHQRRRNTLTASLKASEEGAGVPHGRRMRALPPPPAPQIVISGSARCLFWVTFIALTMKTAAGQTGPHVSPSTSDSEQ